jgi:hypothetical protein
MPAGRGIRSITRRRGRGALNVGVVLAIVTPWFLAPALADPGPANLVLAPASVDVDEPGAPDATTVSIPEAARRGADRARAQQSALARGTTPIPSAIVDAEEPGRWDRLTSWVESALGRFDLDDATAWLTSVLSFLGALVGFLVVTFTFLWWPVRRWRHPRVAVKPLAVSPSVGLTGEHLAGLLANELSSTTSGPSFKRVSDAAAGSGVDLARAVGGNLGWLAPMLAKLSLRKVLVVCGDAWGAAPADGPGTERATEATLTVSVTDQQGRVVARSFPAEACGPSIVDLIQAQVPLAGAWLTDRLQRSGATKRTRRTAWFGTTEWWSWGKFRQGVWYGDHDRTEDAEVCYREAITADIRNAAAWLNLAALKVVDTEQLDEAIELVQMADTVRRSTRRAADHRWPSEAAPRDPLWYRVRTIEIVALLNRNALSYRPDRATSDERDRERAHHLALQLVRELARMQRRFEHPLWGPRRRERLDDLHQLVDATEDYAVALLAGSTWRQGSALEPDPPPERDRRGSLVELADLPATRAPRLLRPARPSRARSTDDVLRLLAGLRIDPRVAVPAGPRHAARRWLQHIRTRMDPHAPDLGRLRPDPADKCPPAWPHEAISPRAHYNLACLYARASTDDPSLADTALRHLRYGVAHAPKRARWASEDPELEPLRTCPATQERFARVLEQVLGAPQQEPGPERGMPNHHARACRPVRPVRSSRPSPVRGAPPRRGAGDPVG